MKQFLNLLKKEFLLSKLITLVVLLGNLASLPLAFWLAESDKDAFPMLCSILFCMISFFSLYLVLATLAGTEKKFSKADAALCSTPYPRSKQVLARYAYLFCVFLMCLVIHVLERLILPGAGMLTIVEVLLSLLMSTAIACIYLPISYRFSSNVATIVLLVFYFAVLFAFPSFLTSSQITDFGALLSAFAGLSELALSGLMLAAILVLFALSSFLSIRFYQKKDL